MHAKVFSIQIFQYFRQIPPRVYTLVLFIDRATILFFKIIFDFFHETLPFKNVLVMSGIIGVGMDDKQVYIIIIILYGLILIHFFTSHFVLKWSMHVKFGHTLHEMESNQNIACKVAIHNWNTHYEDLLL